MNSAMNVLIADDHKLLLQSFSAVLAGFSYVKEVRTCLSYQGLEKALEQQVPDVLFLDINLPPNNGLAICKDVRKQYPYIHIIILTSHTEQARIKEAQNNGANAYFIKSVDIDVVDRHLRKLMAGGPMAFVIEGLGDVVEEQQAYYTNVLNHEQLTPREKQIAELLVQGKDHSYIARVLNISYDTFKTHRTNILGKLGYKSVPELISSVYRNNKL